MSYLSKFFAAEDGAPAPRKPLPEEVAHKVEALFSVEDTHVFRTVALEAAGNMAALGTDYPEVGQDIIEALRRQIKDPQEQYSILAELAEASGGIRSLTTRAYNEMERLQDRLMDLSPGILGPK